MAPPFLTAEWKYLVMLNYEIDPAILHPFVPRGTELDSWQSKTYVSMVAFQFLRTRVLGLPIPFHENFEEVNLRFYVRRLTPEGNRRAVVFIKELVPRPAIAWTARLLYNENYVALPMGHDLQFGTDGLIQKAAYTWKFAGEENRLEVQVQGESQRIQDGSVEEFITEHYWGYTPQRDGGTIEYQVEHPRWKIWSATSSHFHCPVEKLYGPAFVSTLAQPPVSAFLADGSAIIVRQGRRLTVG